MYLAIGWVTTQPSRLPHICGQEGAFSASSQHVSFDADGDRTEATQMVNTVES